MCVCMLLQVRSKLSTFGFGGPTEVTCGGNALKFYASVRLNIKRTAWVKKGEEVQIISCSPCILYLLRAGCQPFDISGIFSQ